ncbi:laminin subunit alpha-1-like [Sinocyclocheilus grahami]|uniref:laminin subunit alpha-1-like n=1 Tax=Sinocyclocheilus grahami TaxID=75366 RepID=UPI0007ACF4DF|nr:PREDICTED: laminin subunit alpha-1-like [Sinocyclocheilus grahami]
MKTSDPDSLLFYMGSSASEDFMALEMHHGKVSFLWDSGSGLTRLEYPDVQINNDRWHRINATRFGRHGTLTIQQTDSEPLPAVKTTASGSSTVMDVSRSTWVFVGGLGAQVKKPPAVRMTHFRGCMSEASLNENNIGLWNYAERQGECGGCFMSPRTEDTSFHFDGSGFSVVEKSLRSMSTSVVMFFKTLSPNGLLLYLASNGTRDFLSIELVEGKVHLTFELGSGALTLTSSRTFNTGTWYRIALQRNKRRGDALLSHPLHQKVLHRYSDVIKWLLDLSSALRYEDVDMDSCLLEERPKRVVLPDELEAEPTSDPSTRPLSPLAELSTLTHGSSSCAAADLTETIPESLQFGLSRHSHVIMGFKNKTVRTSFAVKLSVRTFAGSGVLFYMANANQQDYAVLQVLGGRVLLSCDLGRGPAHASLATPINDGLWHTVKAEFSKKTVMVSVDGTDSDRTHTKGHTLDVEGKLYLGGLPATYTARRIGNVTHSLAACLRDVMFSGVQMKLSAALSSHAAGSCFRRAQSGSFFSGSGYAAFMKEGYNVGSDVSVSLDFRSTAPDGVLLGISSTKVDAIGLELVNGQVVFNVNNGAGRITARSRSAVSMCDGRWRTLMAKKQKHSLRSQF